MSLTPFVYNRDPYWYGGGSDVVPFGNSFGGLSSMVPYSAQQLQDYGLQAQKQLLNSMPSMKPFSPLLSADLIETPTDFQVHCDLPGVDPKDLDITLAEGSVIIRADRKEVHEVNTDTLHKVERNYGKVKRELVLPRNANVAGAVANFENGVLCIRFPKIEGMTTSRKLLIA